MTTTVILEPAQTFATMLQTLRSRCGLHATIGSAPALESILTEANQYCWAQLDDGHPMTSTVTLTANNDTYPWESDDSIPIARGSVREVWIVQGSTDRRQLPQGISHAMRALTDVRSIPERYDSKFVDNVWTFEVWPAPDQTYVLYVDHDRVLTRFNTATDRPSVDAALVLGYAIAMGKAHYGKADADTAGQAFKTMLYNQRVNQKENRRFIPPSAYQPTGPYVVATAGGFRQVG